MRDALRDVFGLWPEKDTALFLFMKRFLNLYILCRCYCRTRFLLFDSSSSFIYIVEWRSLGRSKFHSAYSSVCRINRPDLLQYVIISQRTTLLAESQE